MIGAGIRTPVTPNIRNAAPKPPVYKHMINLFISYIIGCLPSLLVYGLMRKVGTQYDHIFQNAEIN